MGSRRVQVLSCPPHPDYIYIYIIIRIIFNKKFIIFLFFMKYINFNIIKKTIKKIKSKQAGFRNFHIPFNFLNEINIYILKYIFVYP